MWFLWAFVLAAPLRAIKLTPTDNVVVKETITVQNKTISNPFSTTLLIIHCRLPQFLMVEDPEICDKRKPLYQGYKKYFGDIMWMTRDNCKRDQVEPHDCLSAIVGDKNFAYDGVFYLHFDALLKPANLAQTFDNRSMAFFGVEEACPLKPSGLLKNCSWGPWNPEKAKGYARAIRSLNLSSAERSRVREDFVWIGMDDVFYMPRKVFSRYVSVVEPFRKNSLHHEFAGASIRRILTALTNVPDKSMNCTGDCCKSLNSTIALKDDFRCGHAFRLDNVDTRESFKRVLSLDRPPQLRHNDTEVLARLLEEATA